MTSNIFDFYLAQFVDIHGRAKCKLLPAAHKEIVSRGAGFAGFAISGMGLMPNDKEYVAKGDLSKVRVASWLHKTGIVTCDGFHDGVSHPLDPRFILKTACTRLKEKTGIMLNVGIEPEFFLVPLSTLPEVNNSSRAGHLSKPCYDYLYLVDKEPYLHELVRALQHGGLDVYAIDHEDAIEVGRAS